MKTKEAINQAIKKKGLTQEEVGKRMGYSGQSGVSNLIAKDKNKSLRVESLIAVLNAAGYELTIVDRETWQTFCVLTEDPEAKKKKPERKKIPEYEYRIK